MSVYYCLAFALFLVLTKYAECSNKREFLLVAVATNETDGFLRFQRSALVNGLNLKILGLGTVWRGGNIKTDPGGGFKVNLFKKELENHKNRDDLVVMFTDSYDVMITAGEEEILRVFDNFKANAVFGAEDFCWPDFSLKSQYPKVIHGYRYLNSGGFIGYASTLYKIITQRELQNKDDDQLYYTQVFLNETLRNEFKIKLDTQAKIFQNLNGNQVDVALEFLDDDTRIINTVYMTTSIVAHGNGPTKVLFNSLGNYVAKAWTKTAGCMACDEGRINMETKKESEYFVVTIAIFIERPAPFLGEMLQRIVDLNYPKDKIDLYLHNGVESSETLASDWVTLQKESKEYRSVKFVSFSDNIKEWHSRNLAVQRCRNKGCDLLFIVNSDVHLNNPDSLKLLISYNRPIIAPILMRIGKAWSNFWGAVTTEGFYARSSDYMDIVNYVRRGIWNVPYINSVYVIWRSVMENPETEPNFIHKLFDPDMAMTSNFRNRDVFMYATNLEVFGHLVDTEAVATDYLYNDLWQVATNKVDWEHKYLHPDYYKALDPNNTNEMPCQDVYWFPLFSERFCKELIDTCEGYGEWSGGKNQDPRLTGGYENVPTVDIHMNQINFEQEWLYILKTYVKPLAEKIFIGYTSDAKAIMNFVVRYKPTEQPFLRPHHDSSTYTINIGLNRPNIDYEGGGAHFLRYNCSVKDTKVGWALMHPGRLTHYHEGLKTTKGTRYIMVSFIDP